LPSCCMSCEPRFLDRPGSAPPRAAVIPGIPAVCSPLNDEWARRVCRARGASVVFFGLRSHHAALTRSPTIGAQRTSTLSSLSLSHRGHLVSCCLGVSTLEELFFSLSGELVPTTLRPGTPSATPPVSSPIPTPPGRGGDHRNDRDGYHKLTQWLWVAKQRLPLGFASSAMGQRHTRTEALQPQTKRI
jgi:hypothetical protein